MKYEPKTTAEQRRELVQYLCNVNHRGAKVQRICDDLAACEAALAEEQAKHQWQPIETAPKDGTAILTYRDRDQSQQDREEKPELPKGWKPPFSVEVSMHDGRFYLRDANGDSLEYDSDNYGSTLVLGGNPEPIEAIAFALNMAYGDTK